MNIRALCAAALALLPFAQADAEGCHFKTAYTIVCTEPLNAAVAYNGFGFDGARIGQSYNLEILHESGCGRAYAQTYGSAKIEQMNQGRVALPTGWVNVSVVVVNGNSIWYVASDYIEGICARFKPSTGVATTK